MSALGVSAALFLIATIVIQWLLVVWWCRTVRERLRGVEPSQDRQPSVTVVLCLRGRDPSLPECLMAIAEQDYRSYRVLCVVDSQSDEAVGILKELSPEHAGRFQLIVAAPPTGRCSLKCNSLVSALDSIGQSCEVIALVDADGVPDKNWLRDLTRPLENADVAVSSGCRWFVPPDNRCGTLVRWLWNLAASVQLVIYRIPWGGSVAFRRDFADSVELREVWSKSLFDDTQLYLLAKKIGKRTVVLPELLIPGRESTSLLSACRWMQRQLLNVRLYHPAFRLAALHCLSTNFALAAAFVAGIAGYLANDSFATGLCGIAFLIWISFYVWSLRSIEGTARVAIAFRSGKLPEYRPSPVSVVAATGLAQAAYFFALTSSYFLRSIRWRGVQYRFRGPFDVQIETVDPITTHSASGEPNSQGESI